MGPARGGAATLTELCAELYIPQIQVKIYLSLGCGRPYTDGTSSMRADLSSSLLLFSFSFVGEDRRATFLLPAGGDRWLIVVGFWVGG